MGQKVHPYGFRLGIVTDWKSRWFAKTPAQYREGVSVDATIRTFLKKRLRGTYVTSIEIERNEKHIRILIKTSRPGLIIGRGGEGSQKLVKEIEKAIRPVKGTGPRAVKIDIEEVRSAESQAPIVGWMIAEGLEKQQTFRRVMKQTIEKVMANRDVQGVRIALSGRLGGAERLEVLDRLAVAVAEHDQRVALGDEVLGHAVAHQADTDEADHGLGRHAAIP